MQTNHYHSYKTVLLLYFSGIFITKHFSSNKICSFNIQWTLKAN